MARSMGLEPPQFEQPQYNMFHRQRVESEYFPMYQPPYNFGTTIWSPLSSGVLTGKYNNGVPAGSRLTQPGYEWLKARLDAQRESGVLDKVAKLTDLATQRLGCSMTQLALAWCVKNSNVTTVLLGATNLDQLKENLGCMAVLPQLTTEIMDEIDTILGNAPDAYQGYGGAGMRKVDTI